MSWAADTGTLLRWKKKTEQTQTRVQLGPEQSTTLGFARSPLASPLWPQIMRSDYAHGSSDVSRGVWQRWREGGGPQVITPTVQSDTRHLNNELKWSSATTTAIGHDTDYYFFLSWLYSDFKLFTLSGEKLSCLKSKLRVLFALCRLMDERRVERMTIIIFQAFVRPVQIKILLIYVCEFYYSWKIKV